MGMGMGTRMSKLRLSLRCYVMGGWGVERRFGFSVSDGLARGI